ncbi:MAG: site-specific integrase [Clostridia bacterium]|nr:site-specific integrase [Clostridia bacterium]
MYSGRLQEKNGVFQMVFYCKDKDNKKIEKWKSTKLPVRGNRRKAEQLLAEYLEKLNKNVDIFNENKNNSEDDVLFGDYMIDWVETIKNTIEPTTYAGYIRTINGTIAPYFNNKGIRLKNINGRIIDEFYNEMLKKVSANTVIHFHAYIRKALQDAFKNDLIPCNYADKAHRPKKTQYIGNYYNSDELLELFDFVKGKRIEFAVLMAGYYGLRRGEILGLKWSNVDFTYNTITIRHTISECSINGKEYIYAKDRAKTKKSIRTLPIIPPVKELLNKMKERNEFYKEQLGNRYNTENDDYIYKDEYGRIVRPDFVSQTFNNELKKHPTLPHIRFHDLRHSCAALLRHEGVPMEDIQKWLGHSQISTTESIYAHFENEMHQKSAEKLYRALSVKDSKK